MADDVADAPQLRRERSMLGLARFDWTAERVALLTRRWAEGASARTIAVELGRGLSRCAVLGKVHRLRLPQPELKHRHKEEAAASEPRRPRGRPRGSRSESPLMAAFRAIGLVPPLDTPQAPFRSGTDWGASKAFGQACSLAELNAATCRWPIGEPDEPGFAFCGAVPFARYPYCIAHCLIAYRPERADGEPASAYVARPLHRAA